MFMVRNMSYRLIGITKHGLHIVKPHRLPGYILFMMGVILSVCGILNLTPENIIPSAKVLGLTLSGNTIVLIAGAAIAFMGILIIGLLRERYAVRIATAEGEKDVVVSNRKEYVNQIVNALNAAFNFVRRRGNN
jgi:hypothetical protein